MSAGRGGLDPRDRRAMEAAAGLHTGLPEQTRALTEQESAVLKAIGGPSALQLYMRAAGTAITVGTDGRLAGGGTAARVLGQPEMAGLALALGPGKHTIESGTAVIIHERLERGDRPPRVARELGLTMEELRRKRAPRGIVEGVKGNTDTPWR